jgi:hypothetical protein
MVWIGAILSPQDRHGEANFSNSSKGMKKNVLTPTTRKSISRLIRFKMSGPLGTEVIQWEFRGRFG